MATSIPKIDVFKKMMTLPMASKKKTSSVSSYWNSLDQLVLAQNNENEVNSEFVDDLSHLNDNANDDSSSDIHPCSYAAEEIVEEQYLGENETDDASDSNHSNLILRGLLHKRKRN